MRRNRVNLARSTKNTRRGDSGLVIPPYKKYFLHATRRGSWRRAQISPLHFRLTQSRPAIISRSTSGLALVDLPRQESIRRSAHMVKAGRMRLHRRQYVRVGAAWNRTVPAAGFFTEAKEGSHINELELAAALYALEKFFIYARHRHFQLVTDSLDTAHIVPNLTSRSPRLLHKLRRLRSLCEENGVTLSTRHLPSVLNCWADWLSRRRDSFDWDLPPDAGLLLERRLRLLLLPLDGNALPGGRPPPGVPVVLPRPALVGVWVRKMIADGHGVLIAPRWEAQ